MHAVKAATVKPAQPELGVDLTVLNSNAFVQPARRLALIGNEVVHHGRVGQGRGISQAVNLVGSNLA